MHEKTSVRESLNYEFWFWLSSYQSDFAGLVCNHMGRVWNCKELMRLAKLSEIGTSSMQNFKRE